jgi:hypothetical protein
MREAENSAVLKKNLILPDLPPKHGPGQMLQIRQMEIEERLHLPMLYYKSMNSCLPALWLLRRIESMEVKLS